MKAIEVYFQKKMYKSFHDSINIINITNKKKIRYFCLKAKIKAQYLRHNKKTIGR